LHHSLAAFYLELCQIQSWSMGFGAGQNMILENVSMLYDRLVPIASGPIQDINTQSANIQAAGNGDFTDVTPGGH
jgi:hypothetical protein